MCVCVCVCVCVLNCPSHTDPAYYERSVPNLDGCEGHSEHIIFGSNIEVSLVQSEDGAANLATEPPQEEAGEKTGGATSDS